MSSPSGSSFRYLLATLSLLSLAAVPTTARNAAPAEIGEPVEYAGHTYYLLDNQSWSEAEAEAIALGGHLVAINSAEENDFILETFAEDHIWIGFSDHDDEGAWGWTNGDEVTFANWRGGEPNDLFGEDYGHMHGRSHGERGTWNDLDGTWLLRSVAEVPRLTMNVTVDVKPGSFPNSVNPKAKGVLPVAILTTRTDFGDASNFDASLVDPLSVRFGAGAAIESHGRGHLEDVDGDGDLDLLLHFEIEASGILCGDALAGLSGTLFGGSQIAGIDSLRTVGCR